MRKSIDNTVIVMITGTSIPAAVNACIRTQLHHSERSSSTRKSVAVSAGADHRIHELNDIRMCAVESPFIAGVYGCILVLAGCKQRGEGEKGQKKIFMVH